MIVGALSFSHFKRLARTGRLVIAYGSIATRVKASPTALLRDIYDVYHNYQTRDLSQQGADFTINVRAASYIRRFFRPSYYSVADKHGPFAPLPLDIAFVGYEMSQNWQIACTFNRRMVFHAASVADGNGNVILMPGASGSGKSTLGAAMGFRGWHFLGDEFATFSLENNSFASIPRPISLKNQSIDVMKSWVPDGHFSRVFEDTPKGNLAYLEPPLSSLEPLPHPAPLSLVVFPRFADNAKPAAHRLRGAQAAIELTNACVNYSKLGQPAFEQIVQWANTVPVFRVEYGSLEDAVAMVGDLQQKMLRAQ